MGSVAGKEVYENGNVYCASKYAVDAINKSMRIDLLKHGIKVTGIHPGAVETEFSMVRFKGDELKAATPTRILSPYRPMILPIRYIIVQVYLLTCASMIL